MRLSTAAKTLMVTLAAYIVLDVLLTPVGGIETRPVSGVKAVGFVALGLLFLGLALAIFAMVLLFRRSPRAPMVAIVAAVLYFPAFLVELAGIFSSFRPPAGISRVEWGQAVVAILAIGLGFWLLRTGSARKEAKL